MQITISIGVGASALQGLPDDTFSLRSFSNTDYITAEDGVVLAGDIKHNYRETTGGALNATTKIPTYPNLVLPSSTDAGDNQTGRWTTLIVDSSERQVGILFEGYEIPHALGASITLLQLTIHNDGTTAHRDTTTLTRGQVEALIAESVGLIGTGTQTIAGNKTFTGATTFGGSASFNNDADVLGVLSVLGGVLFNGGVSQITPSGLFAQKVGADVASGATIIPTGQQFKVTGAVTITDIDMTGIVAGVDLTITFTSTAQMTNGGKLIIGSNFTGRANRVIKLFWDGANLLQVSRSSN